MTPEEISKQIVEVVRNILGCNSDTVEDLIAQAIKAEREAAQGLLEAISEAPGIKMQGKVYLLMTEEIREAVAKYKGCL